MSIDQSIMLETVEQLNELRKKVHELETSRKKQSQQFTTTFAILKDQPPLEIAGIALAVGEWNGVLYTADEIRKLEKQLPGTPVLVEHGRDPEFGNTQVGVFTEAKWDDMIDALLFKAKITDERAIQAVVKKKFPAISLSNRLFYVPDNGKIRGVDLELIEGSLVANPACEVCYITKTAECLTKIFGNEFKSKMSIHNLEQIREVNMIMESEKKKVVMLRSEEEFYIDIEGVFPLTVDQLNTLAEKLEIDRRFTKKEELELVDAETNAKKKVTRIYYVVYYPYYGYPYGYPYGYYGYPYKYPPKETKSLSAVKTITKDFGEYMVTIEVPIEENVDEEIKKLMTEPLKVYVCPVCGKEFKDNKEFMEHWMKEHAEQYGTFKGKIPTEEKSEETPEVPSQQEQEIKQEQVSVETPAKEQEPKQTEQSPEQTPEQEPVKQEAETAEQQTEEVPKEEMKTEDEQESEEEMSEEKEEEQLSELSPAEALLELIKRDRLEASGTTE